MASSDIRGQHAPAPLALPSPVVSALVSMVYKLLTAGTALLQPARLKLMAWKQALFPPFFKIEDSEFMAN